MDNYDSIFTKDELRNISNEFKRLKDKTYLDYAGAGLSPEIQITNITNDLTENLYPNPHTSKYTTDCIDQVRFQTLNHFKTDDSEYSLVFTSGATESLKLAAETFVYDNIERAKGTNDKHGTFIYLHDNHTSVLGMRDVADSKSANVIGISRDELMENMSSKVDVNSLKSTDAERALFVYPAQCNFSGYKYPLNWIGAVHNGTLNKFTEKKINKKFSEWAVLLDAAAFVSTNTLNLTIYKPDFICVSFYKIFGYPTGLGALLVKNTSAKLLANKTYYGGGTVEIAMSKENYHVKRSTLHERFEDGTIPFLSILALKHGFDALNKIIPKKISDNYMDTISLHTFNLAQYFYGLTKSLHHHNGKPVFILYADTSYDDPNLQGGIVNFNIMRDNGEYIGYAEVVHMAELFDIILRSGCFCNPGACQRHLNLSDADLLKHHKAGHKCGDNNDLINGVPTGSLRVSFGYMSTQKDIDKLIKMVVDCFVEVSPETGNLSTFSTSQNTHNEIIPEICTNDSTILKDFHKRGILKEIYVYPIKSCAAFKVERRWEICHKGLKYDRDWMIVNESGVAVTQKQDTRMCLIAPIIDLERQSLTLTFPGVQNVSTPLMTSKITSNNICHSKVCGDKVQGYDCGDEIADWLTDVLGIPGLRLLKQAEQSRVQKNKSNGNGTSISLSNQAQYLLVNIASVKWLSDKVTSREFDDRIDNLIKRFRGNIVVETDKEFDELKWTKLNIGSSVFQVQGSCTRCQMICIDQESGEKTTEPLRTISKELQGKLNFGMYLSHESYIQNDDTSIKCDEDLLILEQKVQL